MIGPVPFCLHCIHYHEEDFENFSCDAFPDGIPEDIVMCEFDHNTPYPNSKNPTDNGIQFEPIEEPKP